MNMTEVNEFNQIIGNRVDNWVVPQFPDGKDNIQGANITLVPFDVDAHSKELFDAFKLSTNDSWTYLPYGPFEELSDFSKSMISVSTTPDIVTYTVLDATKRPVGTCSYLRILPSQGNIEIGHIHFSPLLKKSTAATESIFLLIRKAFELGYRRVEWKCDSLNKPSWSAALRFGFIYEGIFRQHMMYKGRNRDTAWFAIIDGEWPDKKARFEKWLHPSNFDANGQQIIKLADI